jgi:hypothetical protein
MEFNVEQYARETYTLVKEAVNARNDLKAGLLLLDRRLRYLKFHHADYFHTDERQLCKLNNGDWYYARADDRRAELRNGSPDLSSVHDETYDDASTPPS